MRARVTSKLNELQTQLDLLNAAEAAAQAAAAAQTKSNSYSNSSNNNTNNNNGVRWYTEEEMRRINGSGKHVEIINGIPTWVQTK